MLADVYIDPEHSVAIEVGEGAVSIVTDYFSEDGSGDTKTHMYTLDSPKDSTTTSSEALDWVTRAIEKLEEAAKS